MLDHPWNTTIHRTISARWTTIGPKEKRSRLIIARNRIGSRMTHVVGCDNETHSARPRKLPTGILMKTFVKVNIMKVPQQI